MLSRLLIAAVFMVCAAVVFWLALVHTVHLGTVAVPDLYGMSTEDAEGVVHDLGLSVVLEDEGVFSASVEAGAIAEQEPLPGFHVKTGSQVTVRLSVGNERVVVPEMRGSSLQSAQRDLELAGLLPGSQSRVSGQARGDFILASSPAAATAVAPAAEVHLLVNVTPQRELWVMPSLVSRSVDLVRQFSRANNLRLGHVHEVPYPGLPRGTVLRQYPPAGSPLSRSDIITIWASH